MKRSDKKMNWMKMSKISYVLVSLQGMVIASACGKTSATDLPDKIIPDKLVVQVHLQEEQQTMHSFGASDCWTGKFIGQWADEQKKNHIADLLFSMDTLANGNPKGIGLSLWRFNIGSGSFEQGANSNIADEWRREECFLNADGTYDWNKQAGQQWFLQAAKQRGVQYTLGFSLTPPTFMAKNGKAYHEPSGTELNIQAGKLSAYADFMAQVTKHFQFDYLSPVNEPQWQWGKEGGSSQEGSPAENGEIASLVKLLSEKLTHTGAKIVVGEAGQLDFLYGRNNDGRGDQIHQFFDPSSPNYIGNLAQVEHAISAHSYFTTCPDNNLVQVRKQVAAKVQTVDASLQTWQTEFGILGNICNQYNGSPRNRGIDYGLYVAKVIHHDLTIANNSSWQWWLAMSPYNYSDALVYINAPSGEINVSATKTDGTVLESKQLWCFGNFARFIRPGMKRVTVSVPTLADPVAAAKVLMVSAYKSEDENQLVVVLVNPENKEKIVQLSGLSQLPLNVYTTNATKNLAKSTATADALTITPLSVTTLVTSLR